MNATHETSRPTNICQACGTPLPDGVPPEQCPRCLLAAGLSTERIQGPSAATETAQATKSHDLPRPGDLFGHYRISRFLGQGGMGAVFEAEDVESGRRVALKVLGQSLDSFEARERFLREGRLAGSINHPNSVYVYGTEEIGGIPVIAMELVPGGTLRDRVVARGPLPVGEAVDATMQIITGLEAAQASGILHRDVKPSNCFEDVDGTVKIGDFGLSVSSIRTDAIVTSHGAVLGTPAFSSPEQLRGEELNVRSDIYSVGGTLFYLLTGRTPFEGRTAVQVIANVLEQTPPSPAQFRAAIPDGLARAVLRCLEKQPGERFASYEGLRQALVSYSSLEPAPAPLAVRFLAGAADVLALGLVGIIMSLVIWGEVFPFMAASPGRMGPMLGFAAGSFAVAMFYYAITEGVWGASLGKALCRLRVVAPSRNPPGIPRAMIRALLFHVVPALPFWVWMGFDPARGFLTSGSLGSTVLGFTHYVLLALLFASARRRNGWAAVHDLITRTRVIRQVQYASRPVSQASAEAAPKEASRAAVGPYAVLETVESSPGGEWLLGFDTRLLRRVWIHVVPPGTPPLASALRQVGRVGRLRWMAGKRLGNENWDAFESLPGKPLLELVQQRQPWDQVRFWLLDLARELELAAKDGTRPAELALDRVWITKEGRAKLLDFPAPGLAGVGSPTVAPPAEVPPVMEGHAEAARFLAQVANAALGGTSEPALGQPPAVPLPLPARDFLRQLPGLADPGCIVKSLQQLVHHLTRVSRARRLGVVVACTALPLIASVGFVFASWMLRESERQQPGIMELGQLLEARSRRHLPWEGRTAGPEDRWYALYVASQYRDLITNSNHWNSLYAMSLIKGANRKFAEESVAKFPHPAEEEVDQAADVIEPVLARVNSANLIHEPWFPLAVFGFTLMIYVAAPALLAALLFRGGVILRGLRIAIVRRDGAPASRLRMTWRGILAWAPVFAWPIAFASLKAVAGIAGAALILIALAGVVALVSSLLPGRGVQDRLAGTHLVPR
ncbi:MAG: protein kinase [Verrucomicrobiia bacterium]